jgi:predicted enzyme related to lactoylglutathione lyase
MKVQFDLVTIDVLDPRAAAGFWCAAVGLAVCEDEDDGRWIVLSDASGRRTIGLQRSTVAELDARPHSRIHLDLRCEPVELDAEVERLTALGAVVTAPPRVEPYGRIATFTAPDGTVFCLVAYDRVG